jgi:hypothetical protein
MVTKQESNMHKKQWVITVYNDKKVLGHFKSHPAALRFVRTQKLDWTNMPAELLAVKPQEA